MLKYNIINTGSYIGQLNNDSLSFVCQSDGIWINPPFFNLLIIFLNRITKERVVVFFLLDDSSVLILFVPNFVILYEITTVNTEYSFLVCVTLCGLGETYQFGGIYCLHFKGTRNGRKFFLEVRESCSCETLILKVSYPKRLYPFTK
jgi:hypothetical protein